MSTKYEKLKKAYKEDPEMLRIIEHKELMDKLGQKNSQEIKAEYIKGEKGDKGDTPEKGVDYFTPDEVDAVKDYIKAHVKEEVRPIKGKDYFDGTNGEPGKDADESKIVEKISKLIPTKEELLAGIKVPQPKEVNPDDIIKRVLNAIPKIKSPTLEEFINEIKTKKLIELRDIKGARLDMNDMRWHGGGISNITGLITAGSHISLTGSGTSSDPYVINSTASGAVISVTGLNTDNTDPANPIVKISVDGVTITGLGTPGSPLVATNVGTVTSVSGTANRITSTGGATPVIDISASYVGQSSITTLGTIGTGIWQGTSISTTYTDAKLKTLTGTTNRISISGTATDPIVDISASYVGQSSITTLGTIGTGVWQGTAIAPTYMTVMTATVSGIVPTPPNNTTTFLRGDGTWAAVSGAAGGTVTNIASADGSITITNPTTTADLSVVKAPKLTTARTIGGVSFDGTANITVLTATGGFTVSGGDLALGTNNITMSGSLGTTGTRLTKGWFTDLQVTNAIAGSITGNAATVTTNANLTGPITSVGNATTVANSINLPGSPTTTTQSPSDNSTKIATTAYVDNAILGQNFKEACKVATTANLVGVYLNGTSGVGATFTYTATGVDTIDGVTLAVGNRVLLKNQTTDFQNGIYVVTTAGALGVAGVLTRATDSDESTDWKTGDSVFITSGTTLSTTTWAYTGIDSPTMGTTSITWAQTAGQGSFSAGNGITITGTSIAIDTSVTVDKSTAQILTNKTLTTPVINGLPTGTGIASINTASTLVARDGSGNFSAGTITAALTGNASTATALQNARTIGGVSFDGTGNITVATATGGFTVSGGALALGANNLTMTGSLAATGARITKGWFTDLESTNMPTVGGTAILTSLTAPQFTTIELGAASDTTLSRVSAGVIAVEGVTLVDVSSAQGLTNKTLTTPVLTGLPTGTGVASGATASTLVARDANANITANNWLGGYTTTATAAGTTTLTVGSTYLQYFTGSTTQTVKLPVVSTLALGTQYVIVNNSTGAVTVQSSGANTITIIAASTSSVFTSIATTGTDQTVWSSAYSGVVAASGKSLTISNSLTLAGTDGKGINVGAATTGKILIGDGSNMVLSANTFPNASATSRKIIVSDGTNWVASTETYATPGTSGNVLTSDGTNWTSAAPSGGAPKARINTVFETAGRFTTSAVTGSWSFTSGGLLGSNTASATLSAILQADPNSNTFNEYSGSPSASWVVNFRAIQNNANQSGAWCVIGGTAITGIQTSTVKHIGFNMIQDSNAATAKLYASVADGTTESRSAALLTGLAVNDTLDLALSVSGSTVTFYYRKNGGAQSSTTLSSNVPTSATDTGIIQVAQNSTTGNSWSINFVSMSYER